MHQNRIIRRVFFRELLNGTEDIFMSGGIEIIFGQHITDLLKRFSHSHKGSKYSLFNC
ncbi:Uncharacterised protein [Mycobacteroides abscessus]|nr:Uncharacterised protein [Mycobacteroides abscessus]